MVTRKELLNRIEKLEQEKEEFKELVFKSLKALKKQINGCLKEKKQEKDKIKDWLQDERVDEAQSFIHKGVK